MIGAENLVIASLRKVFYAQHLLITTNEAASQH